MWLLFVRLHIKKVICTWCTSLHSLNKHILRRLGGFKNLWKLLTIWHSGASEKLKKQQWHWTLHKARLSFSVSRSRLLFSSIQPPPSPPLSPWLSFSTSLIQELANFLSLFFHFASLCVYPSHGCVFWVPLRVPVHHPLSLTGSQQTAQHVTAV